MTRTGMAVLGIAAVALAGCVGTDRATLERSGGGAAIGAATGAVVGAFSGSPGTGAAIGATLGGAGGYVYDQLRKDGAL